MQQPSFYAVLPAAVRYDARLSASEKIFFAEITSLTETEGYCYASNAYFCHLYGAGERTVQRWLKNLQAAGYLRIEPAAAGEDAHPRRIWLGDGTLRGVTVDTAGLDGTDGGDGGAAPKMAATPSAATEDGPSAKNGGGGAKNGGEGVPKMAPPTSKNNKNNNNTGARACASAATGDGAPAGGQPTAEAPKGQAVRDVFAEFAAGDARLLEALEDFAENRKQTGKKTPLTRQAARRLVAKLRRLAKDANARDPNDYMCAALDESILNGWTDVWTVKEYRPSPPPARQGSKADRPRMIPAGTDAADLF